MQSQNMSIVFFLYLSTKYPENVETNSWGSIAIRNTVDDNEIES